MDLWGDGEEDDGDAEARLAGLAAAHRQKRRDEAARGQRRRMGAHLSAPITAKESSDGGNAFLRWGASGMQGWRRQMEDAHVTETDVAGERDSAVFAVFDGHGGSEVARYCQAHLLTALNADADFGPKTPSTAEISKALIRVFHQMDVAMRTKAAAAELETYKWREPSEPPPRGAAAAQREGAAEFGRIVEAIAQGGPTGGTTDASVAYGGRAEATPALTAGCTAVVAAVRGATVTVANAGDSRAVLCRGRSAVALSEDHKPNNPIEIMRIEAAGGFVNAQGRVNGNLNLSRAIGDQQYKQDPELPPWAQVISAEPDMVVEGLTEEDRFMILACDGVWDVLSNQQAVDFVRQRMPDTAATGAELSAICEQVMDRCLSEHPQKTAGLGTDNMTCLIVQFLHPS